MFTRLNGNGCIRASVDSGVSDGVWPPALLSALAAAGPLAFVNLPMVH